MREARSFLSGDSRVIKALHQRRPEDTAGYSLADLQLRCQAAPPPKDFFALLRQPDCPVIPDLGRCTRTRHAGAGVEDFLAGLEEESLKACGIDPNGLDINTVHCSGETFLLASGTLRTSQQLHRARACGADAVLLPADMTDPFRFESLAERAASLEMGVVAECTDPASIDLALRNNVEGMVLAVDELEELAPGVPPHVCIFARVGMCTNLSTFTIAARGADAMLFTMPVRPRWTAAMKKIGRMNAMGRHPSCPTRVWPSFEAN